ncbi:MAG: hypothetical protein A2V79_02850 [Betaproteobacteria bacterium RBG_16_56_24]|nr:MAG: hypothetical protein A2V79_02850 [Betaproteobacteria bacterium RBG_16_56_24]
MTNELDPGKIAQLLTQSARQLDAATLSALVNARHNALKRQTVHSPVFALTTGRRTHGLIPRSARQWAATGLLAAMLIIGTGYWQHFKEQQISALDVAILTDDLPIEVLLTDFLRS